MKIEKAIKELETALADKWCPWSPELKQAIKLGIEALKQVKERRGHDPDFLFEKLPGETED